MSLLDLDRELTVAINSFHAEWADGIFYYMSQIWTWTPLAILMLSLGWKKWGWKRLLCVVAGILFCLFLSDQLCNIIKNTVCRLRPTYDPMVAGMIHTVNGYIGGPYGFCSAHACNTSCVALFAWLVVRRKWFGIIGAVWVLLNCWSRIYLGVHYVGDIVCGLILGVVLSGLIFLLYNYLIVKYKKLLEK